MLPINDASPPGPQKVDVLFNLEELWVVQTMVRQHTLSGLVWDRDDMRQVHKGIMELRAMSPEKRAGATYAIHADRQLLWLIEAQVPSTMMQGSAYIGRDILCKVFTALGQLDEPDSVEVSDAPEALLQQLEGGQDGIASQDPDPNAAVAWTGAPPLARRGLPEPKRPGDPRSREVDLTCGSTLRGG